MPAAPIILPAGAPIAAAARRVGRTGGRPPKLTDDDIEAAKAMLANPDIGMTQIAHHLGVSPATLYR
jgi:AcrR family transcriptional regulator